MNANDLTVCVEDLRRCQLVDDAQLAEVRSHCATPKELLAELLRRGVLTNYQVEQISRGEGRNLLLGQYVLIDLLGEGGMGQVFKARHQRMKRLVAVKVIRKDTTAGPQAVLRFNQEIEAAAQLSHANVVLAHDAGEADDTLFFVMELVEGIDLGRLVQNVGPLPVGQACDFIRQAALGLQHAHERGLVHRDIKPSNLLLTYAGAIVKILDLGLARLHQGNEEPTGGLTRTGMVMGTPDFISPEQGRDSRSVDIRSDIYSLGCTLYYLLSAQVPFPEGTFTEKLLKHNMDEPPPLAQRRPEISEAVVAVVSRMMAKRPADRYQTPREVVEALGAFAEPLTSAECYRPVPAGEPNPTVTVRVSEMATPEQTGPAAAPPERATKTDKAPPAKYDEDLTPADSFAGAALKPATQWKTLMPPAPGPSTEPLPPPMPGRRRRLLPLLVPAVLGVGFAVGVFYFLPRPRNTEENAVIGLATGPQATAPLAALPEKKVPPPTPKLVPATKKEPPIQKEEPASKKEPKEKPPEPPPAKAYIGRLVNEFRDDKDKQPLRAALTLDGRHALVGWGDQLRLWDLGLTQPAGKPRQSTQLANLQSALGQSAVGAIAIASDGGRVLIGTTKDVMVSGRVTPSVPVVAVWDTDSANEPKLLEGYKPVNKEKDVKHITAVALSPQGNRVLAGSQDRYRSQR